LSWRPDDHEGEDGDEYNDGGGHGDVMIIMMVVMVIVE
jgi:hypothetical protein